jgi:hypothetical protein
MSAEDTLPSPVDPEDTRAAGVEVGAGVDDVSFGFSGAGVVVGWAEVPFPLEGGLTTLDGSGV